MFDRFVIFMYEDLLPNKLLKVDFIWSDFMDDTIEMCMEMVNGLSAKG